MTEAAKSPEKRVTLAVVAGAHGVTGEVRLKLFAASVDSLSRHAQLQVGERTLTLKSVRPGATAIARFAEISSRDAAEALRGQLVTVPRSALPPLAEGEYYHADLIGLPCRSAGGAPLGVIVAVENFGAGDLIEVETPEGRRALVPFKPGVADLGADEVIIDPAFLA
jgi:16S rRNA processing protein RimM